MALKLKRLGIPRVRPLEGGLEAWQRREYDLITAPAVPAPGP